MLHLIKNKPLFPFLLPLFFVLHGLVRNYTAVSVPEAAMLLCYYLLAALFIGALAWLFFRDITKAALFCFCVLVFEFFFGSVQTALKDWSGLGFLGQYRFLLPFSLLLFIGLIIWLKRRKRPFSPIIIYLNVLLLLLILVDLVNLAVKKGQKEQHYLSGHPSASLKVCKDCEKPDIYLILLDQYAGNDALKEVFGFDNTGFKNQLEYRGFHVFEKSNSNYNLTPFSMASILNMDYLGKGMGLINNLNVTYSYSALRNSVVVDYLNQQGYRLSNYSMFDFPGQPSRQYSDFFPYGTDLITYSTFSSKLRRDIQADILSGKLPMKKRQKKLMYKQLQVNNELFHALVNLPAEQNASSRFVYAHLELPHWPYYFDSKGVPVSKEKLEQFRGTNAKDYIEYLQYANTRILPLVDSLIRRSSRPPVIMLLSDHGFRHPREKKGEAGQQYEFSTLAAILLPGENYAGFPKEINGVNFFRLFLNHSFKQQLPMLKDSTINLFE